MKKVLLLFLIAISICTQAESPAALTTLQRVIVLEGKQKITEQHFSQTDSAIVAMVLLYDKQLKSNEQNNASQSAQSVSTNQLVSNLFAQVKELRTALGDLRASMKDTVLKYQKVSTLIGPIEKINDSTYKIIK